MNSAEVEKLGKEYCDKHSSHCIHCPLYENSFCIDKNGWVSWSPPFDNKTFIKFAKDLTYMLKEIGAIND